MAVLEAYSPCPCGSGQKYKWCCQKAEPYAERSVRLQETGGLEAAVSALDEGLGKLPGNPWLTIRKAVLLARREKLGDAATLLRSLLAKDPSHVGAHNFLVRLVIEDESPEAGAAQLQQALSSVKPESRAALGITAQLVGIMLGEAGHVPSALAHLRLAERLEGDDEEQAVAQSLRMIEGNASISPWLRNPYRLSPVPVDLRPDPARKFADALSWADQGLWSSAAAAFETLSADSVAEADRNLGLCRLWSADDASAVSALRRYIASREGSAEAVDLEAICQIISPAQGKDLVGHVQLIWSIRDRAGLLKILNSDPAVDSEGRGPLDPEDEKSPEVDLFALLDRPKPTGSVEGLSPNDLPRVEARISVGFEIAALDLFDDGRLDRIRDRFMDLARGTIPNAHPRTKSLGPVSRSSVALQAEMWLPEGVSREASARLTRAEHERIIREVWPRTPLPYLNGRTPRQAGKDGDAKTALRASFCQFEIGQEFWRSDLDFAALRSEIGVPQEPVPDPSTVDIETLHIARLHRVPVEGLDDARLVALFELAHGFVMPLAMERSAREIVNRPGIFDRDEMDRVLPYVDLANLAISRQDPEEALDWLKKGREADTEPRNVARWDLQDVRIRARSQPPEEWVPLLAAALDRHGQDREAAPIIMRNLMDMGLVQTAPNPDNPSQTLLDTRPLQAVLSRYGPKITTSTGRLGVSATQGGIWTPGGGSSSPGTSIWTPGSGGSPSPPGEDKPKLIIPGR